MDNKPLKILYILPELNVGGVETHVLALAIGMKNLGHEVSVVSNGGALSGRIEAGGVRHITLPVHKKSPLSVNELAHRIKTLCADEKIHVVHSHSRVPAWIGHFATRNTRTAFIITAHGQYSPHIGSRVMGWGDHVICVSRIVMDHMAQKLGADTSHMSVIYNGINMEEALEMQSRCRPPHELRTELGIPENARIIGAVGRLTNTKGIRFFLDAFAMLNAARPETHALIVGDGPMKKELQDYARSIGVHDNTLFTGMRTDVYDMLKLLDVNVVSSLYEGFPMGCLEAMSSRVPIVATRVGGIPEMLEHEKSALLVEPKNPVQLCEAIGRMLDDPDMCKRLAEEGFHNVSSKFSLDTMLSQAQDVYTRVLREKYRVFRSAGAEKPIMPKVMLMLPELRVGGVETHVVDLARGLKIKGYEPLVVSFGGKLVEKLEAENITHIKLPIHSKSPLIIFDMVGQIIKLFDEYKIDLVHAHSRVPAWICYLALRGHKRPFIATCHSTYSVHPGSRVMTWADNMIGVSEFVRRHMLDNFGTPPERITTVHNGISPLLYSDAHSDAMVKKYRAELGLSPTTRVVGMVASTTPRKGYVYFMRAAEIIIKEFPDVVFLGVGGGSQRTELDAMLSDLGLGDKFRFLGIRQDVRDLLCAFDIFVLSSMSEGLPYVILEAMCMKKPIVTTNVGGIPEAIDNGKNGMLVPPRDVDALAATILSLLRDKDKALALGEAAHASIAESFTVDKMVEQTEQIYIKTLG